MKIRPYSFVAVPASLVLVASAPPVYANFFEDGKASLELRNFYFSRDFRDSTTLQSKREEWAQGFILNLQSGFTEGDVGFGLDAVAMLGVKLDSSPDRSGTGLLPRGADKRAEDSYAKVLPTAKVRLSKSELRVGGLSPVLPLLASNNSRLLPQVFTGGQLVSQDLDRLTFTLGRIDSVKQRDSSNSEDLTASAQFGAYSTRVSSDHYNYGGVDYLVLPSLTLSYHLSELEDLFRRDYFGLKFSPAIGPGKAFAELRYFAANEAGQELAGKVDNRTLSSNFGYSWAGQTISAGYQEAKGDSPFPYVSGTDTYLFSEMLVSTFALAEERAWYGRYDYDFAQLGVPGLTFSLRYVKGEDVDPTAVTTVKAAALRASGQTGSEWERSTDLTYVVQSGPLKNLSLRWRNATNRSDYADGADENRLIFSYSISL
ncbi:OprD family porin [Pseudomonas sp. OTU5201]|uniref:OprD family porin n=1 Tax=Pseudomonas sp. OTU5201 TaxID=3043850 RepID=UPI00313DA74B